MTSLTQSLRATEFLPLPRDMTASGTERRTGVEIEFAGIDEGEAARALQHVLGGSVTRKGPHEFQLADTEIGDVGIELDTAFRDRNAGAIKAAALDLASAVVPVEIVTEPLTRAQLPRLDAARDVLRVAGATGTRDNALLGFGVHLNTEVAAPTAEAVAPVLLAYALLEDWLRADAEIDLSRRLLPFVEPYPRRFLDALLEMPEDCTMAHLIDTYLADNSSRNRGLDLLPLFRHVDEARVTAALGDDASAVKARPTWHYRLPDCRIDEDDWRLAQVWNRWRLVECVAADPALLDRLSTAWRDHRSQTLAGRSRWAERVGAILAETPNSRRGA